MAMLFRSLSESSHELVVLRPIEAADISVWYDYLSMPTVFEHTSWALKSATELEPHIWAPETFTPSSALRFAIALRSSGQLVSCAHAHVGLVRVQATALESNHRSMRVLQRCGFEHEGLLRSYRMVRGTSGNFHMYSHVLPAAV